LTEEHSDPMTVMQRKDVNPIAHLTADDITEIGCRARRDPGRGDRGPR